MEYFLLALIVLIHIGISALRAWDRKTIPEWFERISVLVLYVGFGIYYETWKLMFAGYFLAVLLSLGTSALIGQRTRTADGDAMHPLRVIRVRSGCMGSAILMKSTRLGLGGDWTLCA